MAWTDEMVEQLRKMWAEGLTTGEIGRRLGVSKNSIVGKVHRLGLSGRPSPIKKKGETATPAPTVSTSAVDKKVTTKPVKETTVKETKLPESKPAKEPKENKTVKTKVEKAAPAPEPELDIKTLERMSDETETASVRQGKTMLTDLDNHTCRWPLGDPKDENFHFCGKKVRIGQTYCDEHANIAYVKANKK